MNTSNRVHFIVALFSVIAFGCSKAKMSGGGKSKPGAASEAEGTGTGETGEGDALPGNDSVADVDPVDNPEDNPEDDLVVEPHVALTNVFGMPVVVAATTKIPAAAAKGGSVMWLALPMHTQEQVNQDRILIGLGAIAP